LFGLAESDADCKIASRKRRHRPATATKLRGPSERISVLNVNFHFLTRGLGKMADCRWIGTGCGKCDDNDDGYGGCVLGFNVRFTPGKSVLKSGGRRLFSFPKLISKLGLIYLLSVSFMILSVLAVNLIPNDLIQRNLRRSLPSENYSVLFGSSPTDQWAECMGATVGINYELRLIERSLLSPVLGNCEGSWKFLKMESLHTGFNYWRYWHGSQIIMRPALTMMSVLDVRALTFFLFASSFMFAFLALYGHGLHLTGLAMFAGLFCVNLQSALFVLPHAMDWVIGFLACGWIVRKLNGNVPISMNGFSCAFFFVGLLSAFFGSLINPVVTLTIPLFGVFWVIAFQKEKGAVGNFVLVLAATCFWFIGYAASWSTKWLLAAFLVGVDTVSTQILEVVKFRLGGPSGTDEITWTYSFISVIREIWVGGIFTIACLIVSIVPLVRFVKMIERKWSDLSSFVFICALPFIWFAALRNHTIVHPWFVSAGLYTSFAMVFSFLLTSWAVHSSSSVGIGRGRRLD
jgi:hypothetical protein